MPPKKNPMLTPKELREGGMCIRLLADWQVGVHHWHPHAPREIVEDNCYEVWECCKCHINRRFVHGGDPNEGGWNVVEMKGDDDGQTKAT